MMRMISSLPPDEKVQGAPGRRRYQRLSASVLREVLTREARPRPKSHFRTMMVVGSFPLRRSTIGWRSLSGPWRRMSNKGPVMSGWKAADLRKLTGTETTEDAIWGESDALFWRRHPSNETGRSESECESSNLNVLNLLALSPPILRKSTMSVDQQ